MYLNLNNLNQRASAFLDLFRGLAAVLVLVHHAKNSFFVGYQNLNIEKNLAITLFYFLTGFGRQPVIMFFVLSGFLISRSVLKTFSEKRWSWRTYCLNRITRLQVVLIPSLLLTFFWDSLTFWKTEQIPVNVDILTFLGNISFLQAIVVPVYGSNYPLWSLSCEFWYYLLFPLLVTSIVERNFILKSLFVLMFVILLWFVGNQIALYFLIWLLGSVLIFLPPAPKKLKSILEPLTPVLLFVTIAIPSSLARLQSHMPLHINEFALDFLSGISFAFSIYLVVNFSSTQKFRTQWQQFSAQLADFSYTTYLVHAPTLSFLAALFGTIKPSQKWQPSPQVMIYHLGISLAILLYAWFVACLTEANTGVVRNFISKKLSASIK